MPSCTRSLFVVALPLALSVPLTTLVACDDGTAGGGPAVVDGGGLVEGGGGEGGEPTVLSAPAFTAPLADVTVAVGETATFTAVLTGVPEPTLLWQSSTDGGTTWANIEGTTGASFTTPPAVAADTGKRFRVLAKNSQGSAISPAATLTVTTTSTNSNGKVLVSGPSTVIRDDGTDPVALPAPAGAVASLAFSPGGRIIVSQPSPDLARPSLQSLVTVRPDGTGRTVILDAAALAADVAAVGFVGVTGDDTVYYTTSSAGGTLSLGTVKTDGTAAVAPVAIYGGGTGFTNAEFYPKPPGSDYGTFARLRGRILTSDGRLFLSQYDGSTLVRVAAVSPNLTMVTALTTTFGLDESVCGVTPTGTVVYTRRRAGGLPIFEAWANGASLIPEVEKDFYDCQVTPRGRIIVRFQTIDYRRDVYGVINGTLVPYGTTTDDEAYVGETATSIVVAATDPTTSHVRLSVSPAAGGAPVTLSGKDDPAGPFGAFLTATADGRAVFARTTTFGGDASLHSVKLDGTGRLDLVPAGKSRLFESYGATATGRFVYRGLDATSSPRLFSLRTDTVTSPFVPQQTALRNDPNTLLELLLD